MLVSETRGNHRVVTQIDPRRPLSPISRASAHGLLCLTFKYTALDCTCRHPWQYIRHYQRRCRCRGKCMEDTSEFSLIPRHYRQSMFRKAVSTLEGVKAGAHHKSLTIWDLN